MKSLSLFVSAAALLSASSAFALDCATLPTCESLGYNDIVSQCPKSVNGEDLAVKCPFDVTKGKCTYEAAVGQIGYFTKAPNANSGWLLCDGQTITETKYPDLYKFLGQQFCTSDHGGSCGTGVGRVPNYRGYFLRVYGTPNSTYGKVGNTSLTSPQQEGLPNITGSFIVDDSMVGEQDGLASSRPTDAFKNFTKLSSNGFDMKSSGSNNGYKLNFSASNSNTIYGSSIGVTPPNYAVYAYIYAGKVVK